MNNHNLLNNIAGKGRLKNSFKNDFIFGLLTIGGLALTYYSMYLHFELKKRVDDIEMLQAGSKEDHQELVFRLQDQSSIVTHLQQEMKKLQTSLTQPDPPAVDQS